MTKRYFLKCFILIYVLLVFLFIYNTALAYQNEVKNMSVAMSEKIANANKKNIAVVDFMDLQGNITELGRFLAEELSVALVNAGKGFEVVDRANLRVILAEHKFQMSDLVNPQTTKKLGEIAGVDAIITGTITPFAESVRLSVKIIDIQTAKIIGAISGDIPKTDAIKELLAKGVETKESSTSNTTASSSTTGVSTKTKEESKSTTQKVNLENFTFELKECRKTQDGLTFDFIIVNNVQDRELSFGCYVIQCSKMFDDFGNEYRNDGFKVKVANKEEKSSVYSLIISNIPTKASISFPIPPSDATFIKLLKISTNFGIIEFRDIQIPK